MGQESENGSTLLAAGKNQSGKSSGYFVVAAWCCAAMLPAANFSVGQKKKNREGKAKIKHRQPPASPEKYECFRIFEEENPLVQPDLKRCGECQEKNGLLRII